MDLGVRLTATGGSLQEVWERAVVDLAACIHSGPADASSPERGRAGPDVLHEGGVYRGTWLESTGTINAEVLARFLPTVARDTYLLLADRVRADGLLP
jgi:hypothetical protein